MLFDEIGAVAATEHDDIAKSHLVCSIDVWPPVPVSYYAQVVPLSTINWGIHFAEPFDGGDGDAANQMDRAFH